MFAVAADIVAVALWAMRAFRAAKRLQDRRNAPASSAFAAARARRANRRLQLITKNFRDENFYGLGAGVGRGLAVGSDLGVGVGLGVDVAVGVGLAVGVEVGVAVAVGLTVGVGVGVPPPGNTRT